DRIVIDNNEDQCETSLRGTGPSSAFGSTQGAPFQILTVPSQDAEASRRPSGLNATCQILSSCPRRVSASWPVDASQNFTIPYASADATRLPSRLKAALVTEILCPRNFTTSRPVAVSQILTVESADADTRRFPS